MANKIALITGVTGQDGSYLAELLLIKGYDVHGLVRRTSTMSTERIDHILNKINIIEADLGDTSSLIKAIKEVQPKEVYNLAAMSFVPASWREPVATGNITGLGVARILEAIRLTDPTIRFYQASSSELYGNAQETPQNENTPFYPRSPYAVAKLYGHWTTINYRESYNMFACSGIIFNHESPRRSVEFITRKVTDAVAKIHLGLQKEVVVGNLDAKRDWGFAGDAARAMWLILQQEKPDDFVIATGEQHSVKEWIQESFSVIGIENWEKHVKTDQRFIRPLEVHSLLGDYSKAKRVLGWEPTVRFKELVKIMVETDIKRLESKK